MILAIDDDPFRYQHFDRLLTGRVGPAPLLGVGTPHQSSTRRVTHAVCPACVAAAIPLARAILLDHDLGPSYCPCGATVDHQANTREFVPMVRASGLPVIVTSASSRENIRALCDALAGHNYTQISAIEIDPELKWIGWLWTRGVL